MSNLAALEVSFPSSLLATHRYSPLSVLLTFVIVNCFLSAENLILEELWLVSTGNLFLIHDIFPIGFAVLLQDKVTLSPSVFATLWGWTMISGLSVTNQQSIWQNWGNPTQVYHKCNMKNIYDFFLNDKRCCLVP